MKLRTWHITTLAIGILFAATTEVVAQRVNPVLLRENPFRDGGGSCVYDRDGELVNSPKGRVCRDRTNHLDKVDAGAQHSSLVQSFPPALRKQLRQLLSDHEHISVELTELRNLIQAGSRAKALEHADRVGTEVADHRRREEDFINKLADHRAKH